MGQGNGHSPQDLWQAEVPPDDLEAERLLDAESAVLLQVLEMQVGAEPLYELLPALGKNSRLDPFLLSHYRLDPNDLQAAWAAYLSDLTGVPVTPEPVFEFGPSTADQPLSLPPAPLPPPVPPGKQIALVCDEQIWVGDLDGSNLVPLTSDDQRFSGVKWSPDGRWLLTTWQFAPTYGPGALYLLAADGSEARLLTDSAVPDVWSVDWRPDGRGVYYGRHVQVAGGDWTVETWAIEIATGETRQLPGRPIWSPDGRHLVYTIRSPDDPFDSLWLADADWGNARQVAGQFGYAPTDPWSPDGSKLALVLEDQDPDQRAIAIYDLAAERLTLLVTVADLRATIADSSPEFLWFDGWAADGRHLLVRAVGEGDRPSVRAPTTLLLLPLEGDPPRALAHTESGAVFGTAWSPTHPNRLAFAWQTEADEDPNGYLFDLNAGAIFSVTESWNATWSPDGAWVAFAGPNRVTVVDQDGQTRSILRHHNFCSLPAWNPIADLTPPDVACAPGLDLGIAEQDVYRVGELLVMRVHNNGDQPVKNVPARVVDGAGNRSGLMGLGHLPACGNLLVHIAMRDWVSPVTVILNPQDEAIVLPEDDLGDNQVTVALD